MMVAGGPDGRVGVHRQGPCPPAGSVSTKDSGEESHADGDRTDGPGRRGRRRSRRARLRAAPRRCGPAGDRAGARAGARRACRPALDVDGYEFDTGPTVLTMPDLIAEALGAVGEELADWLELTRLDPAYRAHYPDGSTLDVITDTTRMADEISRVCGASRGRRLPALRRLRPPAVAAGARRLHRTQLRRARRDLLTANLLRLALCRRVPSAADEDRPVLHAIRVPGGSSRSRPCTPASPRTTRWRSTPSSRTSTPSPGVYFPRGGIHAVPRALAGAAEKHGVGSGTTPPSPGCETAAGRATGVLTADGERVPADVVVLNPDLPVAYRDLLPGPRRPAARLQLLAVLRRAARRVPPGAIAKIAHHNIHFGRAWRAHLRRGDPTR